MAQPIPVIIDTDVALDDWMATLYLLAHPAVHVIGITTTGVGVAHLTPGTQNILNILAVGGQPQIPVVAGTSAPLSFSNVFPNSFRQTVDGAYGLQLPTNPNPAQSLPAVQFLANTIASAPTPVTILSIGGGTNLAMLFNQQPGVKSNIARIYMMGGAINVPGNVNAFNPDYLNTVAEWNIFVDPLGAQTVLGSGVPLTLIPLDATNQVPLDLNFYVALGAYLQAPPGGTPTSAARLIFSALTTQLSTITAQEPTQRYYFWDPLAAVLLTDTQQLLAKTTTERLVVYQTLDESHDTSGQTAVATDGTPIDVVTSVDAPGVQSQFFTVITGGATYPTGMIPMWPTEPTPDSRSQ